MSGVNEKERKTQERILHEIFEKRLEYTYLGNYEERENNSNIEEDLLLKFLTKKYSEDISKKAIAELKKIAHNESKSLYEVNKEFYEVLKYGKGISIYVGEKDEKVYFIDYNDFSNNDFYVAEEVTVKGQNEKRPDIVIYINGIAIAVIELKRSTVSINEGIRQNLDNQDPRFIERFFTTVQLLVAGNDTEGLRYATTKTPAKYYLPWIEDIHAIGKLHEKVKGLIDTNDFLIDQQIPSLFEKERLIDLIDNFILFDSGIKKVPRYNQYFGVTNAREFVKRNEGGIIWHTQGSGKSLSMVLLAKWILSNVDDSRVVIFTDRKELDKQIKDVFVNTGETKIHRATSCSNLLESLNDYSSGNLICSLIHKVGASVDEDSDKDYADYIKQLNAYKNNDFKAKGNIFVFVDECHRSQAGMLHDEMKRLLPDAPSATYLYIDKKMQDHGLFQAICRVNRLDKDKDLGYIVDYKDLFESIEGAVEDYTSGAFDNFDKEDITGLLKNRLDFCKNRLDNALKQVKVICEPIESPKGTLEFLHYFVGQELSIDESREEQLKDTESRRIEFYNAVSNLVIAYTNIADEMTKAGYTKEDSKIIKEQVNFYNAARDEVMKAAGDYIELKNYDGAMRYMIDNYINADASELQYKLDEATLLDVIVASGIEKATQTLPNNVRKNKKSVALAIEANIASTIINNTPINPRYYNKMSELLKELIDMKKDQNLDYQDYIKHLVELVKKVKNPESSGEYPSSIHNVRLRGLYDILDKDEGETLLLYNSLISSVPYDFMDSKMKQREVKFLIKTVISDESKIDEIFNLWKNTRGY